MVMILEKPAVRKAAMPITVEQYHSLTDAGIIPEQTELIQGVIVERSGKSPLHTRLVEDLAELLRAHSGKSCYVRQEQPITLSDSEPEPDLAVIRGSREDFYEGHPTTAALIVEVAVSTEEMDQEKADLYAKAGVEEYWIVLAGRRQIEVYHDSVDGVYRQHKILGTHELVNSIEFPDLKIDFSSVWD